MSETSQRAIKRINDKFNYIPEKVEWRRNIEIEVLLLERQNYTRHWPSLLLESSQFITRWQRLVVLLAFVKRQRIPIVGLIQDPNQWMSLFRYSSVCVCVCK